MPNNVDDLCQTILKVTNEASALARSDPGLLAKTDPAILGRPELLCVVERADPNSLVPCPRFQRACASP